METDLLLTLRGVELKEALSREASWTRISRLVQQGDMAVLVGADIRIAGFAEKLLATGIPVILFVPAAHMGAPGNMDWEALRHLRKRGAVVGSAGHLHQNLLLRRVMVSAGEDAQRRSEEVFRSKEMLEKQLGMRVAWFCYPQGLHDQAAVRQVRRAGFAFALTGVQGRNQQHQDPLRLRSVDVLFDDTKASLRARILGKPYDPLRKYPSVSVVVPTYNRKRLLSAVLHSLQAQRYPTDQLEIIVADDGGNDGWGRMVRGFATRAPMRIQYLRQGRLGFRAGAARNLGASAAEGDLLLFLDGDVVAHPSLVSEHVRFHLRWPERPVLGYVCAHTCLNAYKVSEVIAAAQTAEVDRLPLLPELRDSAYARVLDDLDMSAESWQLFFSNNVSMASSLFRKAGGFDEDFQGWGIEDNEFGYRLAAQGHRCVLNRRAIGFHIGTEGGVLNPFLRPNEQRFAELARNMRRFLEKHPTEEVRAFLIGLNSKIPEDLKLFPEETDTHTIRLEGVCNNRCSVCDTWEKGSRKGTDTSVEHQMSLLANRRRIWYKGGEPTLRDDFFQLISISREAGFREIGFQTNGRAFAYRDFAERAVRWGATHFEIQLYGADASSHDAITGCPGSFQQTVRGILNLRELCASIALRIVVCDTNRPNEGGAEAFARQLVPGESLTITRV